MSLFAVAGNSTHLFIISEILKVRSPGAGRTRSSIGGWGRRSQGVIKMSSFETLASASRSGRIKWFTVVGLMSQFSSSRLARDRSQQTEAACRFLTHGPISSCHRDYLLSSRPAESYLSDSTLSSD